MLFGNSIMPGEHDWMNRKRGIFGAMREPMTEPVAAPNEMPEQKRSMFGGWRNVAGVVGDALATANDMPAMYAPQMMQRRESDARAQQSMAERAAGREDWLWKQQNTPQQAYRWESNDGSLMELGPDGQSRVAYKDPTPKMNWQVVQNADGTKTIIPVPQFGGGAPAPDTIVDDPRKGGQPGGQPPFGGKVVGNLDQITAGSESGNRNFYNDGRPVVSPKGALFAMQVMPGTARDPGFGLRPANPNDPGDMNRLGREYRAKMQARYGGNLAKMWAAYNWGPGNVDKAIAKHGEGWFNHAPAETRDYIARNLRAARGQ